jgi:hypothetical protein
MSNVAGTGSMTKQYKKYLIGQTDKFVETNYASVNDEISIINEKTEKLPLNFKSEIIISYLKNRSIENIWIEANPQLTALVTSGTLFTGNIESLFDSCRNNASFQQDLIAYLKASFTGNSNL